MHDSDAHSDAKLRKVMMRYGADGYGLYWYCLELIAGKVDASKYTFELEHDAEILAHDLKVDSLRVEEIMRYLVNLGLFENDGGRITCLKMAKRLDTRFTRSPELQSAIRKARSGDVLSMSEDSLSTVAAIREDKREEDKTRENTKNMSDADASDATKTYSNGIAPDHQEPPPTTKPASTDHPGFDEFYAAYPRHEAKKDARKAWNQMRPVLNRLLTDIRQRLDCRHWTDPSYIPLPSTYLRGERWNDAIRAPPKPRQVVERDDRRASNLAVLSQVFTGAKP